MDAVSRIDMSVSEDVNIIHHELSVDPPLSICRAMGDLSVNDLGNGLNEFLNIQDDHKLVSGSISHSTKNGAEKEDIYEESSDQRKQTTLTSEKCLSKSATFPCSSKITYSAAPGEVGEGDIATEVLVQNLSAKSVTPPCLRSISLPSSLKPVSAMKGSREKQGIPPKELSVRWASDVYDPAPTAVSHVVTNKSTKHGKKSARNKQKGGGKASRGNRGKDKKQQARKYGGGTSSNSRCFKSLDVDDDDGSDDFNAGSPDPYCGSSFLKNSVTKLHFSVAEAT